MLNKLLEKFFIKEEREYIDLYVLKSNDDNHIAISKARDYIQFRFLTINIDVYKHYFYPTFWLKCIKELRKKFFYEEVNSDINNEYMPYYSYCYHLIPFVYIIITQEDRRPDLSEDEAKSSLGYKFKTLIKVNLFWLEYSFIFHSLRLGFVFKYDYSKIGTIVNCIYKKGFLNTNLISTDLNSDLYDKYLGE